MISEADEIKRLEMKIKVLEATLRREQIKADMLNKMLEAAKLNPGIDLIKEFSIAQSVESDRSSL